MRNVLKVILLAGLIIAIASCAQPETEPQLDNQIRIIGATYPLSNATIFYYQGFRWLRFTIGGSSDYIELSFENVPEIIQIPVGHWTVIDSNPFYRAVVSLSGDFYSSTADATVDLTISSTANGALTIDGTIDDVNTPPLSCALNYSGTYNYVEW